MNERMKTALREHLNAMGDSSPEGIAEWVIDYLDEQEREFMAPDPKLRADAERYRAWRDALARDDKVFLNTAVAATMRSLDGEDRPPTPDETDAAIDAAIATIKPRGN